MRLGPRVVYLLYLKKPATFLPVLRPKQLTGIGQNRPKSGISSLNTIELVFYRFKSYLLVKYCLQTTRTVISKVDASMWISGLKSYKSAIKCHKFIHRNCHLFYMRCKWYFMIYLYDTCVDCMNLLEFEDILEKDVLIPIYSSYRGKKTNTRQLQKTRKINQKKIERLFMETLIYREVNHCGLRDNFTSTEFNYLIHCFIKWILRKN